MAASARCAVDNVAERPSHVGAEQNTKNRQGRPDQHLQKYSVENMIAGYLAAGV